jgi:catechol 2,3-dioxygenase-like lactoylglutathione lyase family enzyme
VFIDFKALNSDPRVIYEIKHLHIEAMIDVYRISAVTLIIKNMKRSCNFYSQIPGFKLVYGGSADDSFTTYKIGNNTSAYLNLELNLDSNINNPTNYLDKGHCGRIIFHTDDVDILYSYLKGNKEISNMISFENEPKDAPWKERYFHIREPDGYQLSFATPIKQEENY